MATTTSYKDPGALQRTPSGTPTLRVSYKDPGAAQRQPTIVTDTQEWRGCYPPERNRTAPSVIY